jgi:ketosteroid isomerase-like protein
MNDYTNAREFFDTYARALLDRDARAIADHYAVPALIEFPGQPVAVSDAAQTEAFFQGAFEQYEGVTSARGTLDIVAETGHSIWVDVTWTYDADTPAERNLYQLIRSGDAWKIAVLTPMDT